MKKFQDRVVKWIKACFGSEIADDKPERALRFLEESLELVQTQGIGADKVLQVVEHVYSRPVGQQTQEVGGVMVTLAALCAANGMDMGQCAETEISRVEGKVEVIRAKHNSKPKFLKSVVAEECEHFPWDEMDRTDRIPVVDGRLHVVRIFLTPRRSYDPPRSPARYYCVVSETLVDGAPELVVWIKGLTTQDAWREANKVLHKAGLHFGWAGVGESLVIAELTQKSAKHQPNQP